MERVRELTEQGWTCKEIAAEVGICAAIVRKYQSPDFNPAHGQYNITRDSKIKPYAEKIKQMLGEGCTFRQIEKAIREEGYDGASSTIWMYTTRERRLMKEAKADNR